MAKRFTTIENWIEQSNLSKRVKQALLWTVSTDDSELSNGPVLALLAMAGQHGLTRQEIADVLGVDVYDKLVRLRVLGALETGTAGVFILKSTSAMIPTDEGIKRHLTPSEDESVRTNSVRTKRPKRTLHKKKPMKPASESKDLSLIRARVHAKQNRSSPPPYTPTTPVTSSKSVKSSRGVVGSGSVSAVRKKRKQKSYKQNPSENPKYREAKIRKPDKWDHWACLGYWLKKFRVAYEVEDGFFVGSSAKVQERSAWSIWNFVNHENGFNGDLEKWKVYVDWIFAVFLPGADWIDRPIGLGQMVRLPNGEQNFFLQQFRMSKAKLPRKKKTRVTYERKRWGYKKVVVEE